MAAGLHISCAQVEETWGRAALGTKASPDDTTSVGEGRALSLKGRPQLEPKT